MRVLGGLAPITVFTGREPSNPLGVLFPPNAKHISCVDVTVPAIVAGVARLQEDLEKYRLRVAAVKPRTRKPVSGETAVSFVVGDFCLVSCLSDGRKRAKLEAPWFGPVTIVSQTSEYAFVTRNLITNDLRTVHAAHLRLYSDKHLLLTPQLLDHVAYISRGYLVEAIHDHYVDDLQATLLVQYKHESPAEASWQPLEDIFKGVPVKVRSYIKTIKQPLVRAQLLALLKSFK
jgi:hypothetical protein